MVYEDDSRGILDDGSAQNIWFLSWTVPGRAGHSLQWGQSYSSGVSIAGSGAASALLAGVLWPRCFSWLVPELVGAAVLQALAKGRVCGESVI